MTELGNHHKDPRVFDEYFQDEYYKQACAGLVSGSSKKSQFNWYSAIFGSLWCAYRKMYKLTAIVFLSGAAVSFVVGLMHLIVFPKSDLSDHALQFVALGVVFLTVRIPLGLIANRLYFQKAKSVIDLVEKKGLSDDAALEAIRGAGGVSALPLGVIFIVGILLRMLFR